MHYLHGLLCFESMYVNFYILSAYACVFVIRDYIADVEDVDTDFFLGEENWTLQLPSMRYLFNIL